MLHSLKLARSHPYPFFHSSPFGRKTTSLHRSQQAKFESTHSEKQEDKMDKNPNENQEKNLNEKIGDVMSHSFGEAYATRSDVEGFGGIYGGNQSLHKSKDGKVVHEDHPDYDKNQGSHVHEKEKARNGTNAS